MEASVTRSTLRGRFRPTPRPPPRPPWAAASAGVPSGDRTRTGTRGGAVTTRADRTGTAARTPRGLQHRLRHDPAVGPRDPRRADADPGDHHLSWAEVYARARRVGHALDRAGVGPGDRVAFLDRNGTRVLRGPLRLRPARRGQRGRQLAAGPGRDRRRRGGRRRVHPVLRARLRRRGRRRWRPWSTGSATWVRPRPVRPSGGTPTGPSSATTPASTRARTTPSCSSTPRAPPGCPRGR